MHFKPESCKWILEKNDLLVGFGLVLERITTNVKYNLSGAEQWFIRCVHSRPGFRDHGFWPLKTRYNEYSDYLNTLCQASPTLGEDQCMVISSLKRRTKFCGTLQRD
jgi:hypothetical protein